ncbi:MAG: LysR family transcriptional regulator [Paracoccaceae bacterium]
MMTDWQQMPYFLAVARVGSLRAAAEQMNATHATVRRHIQSLETGYGVLLFRRSHGGLELTAAGETLLPIAREAEQLLVKARNGLQGLDREASGLIRVSLDPMTGHLLMAPVFAEFCRLYPDIELEIRLTYEVEDINKLETDVSIRNAAEITEDVVARKLFPSDTGIYASRDYIDTRLPNAGPKGENLEWIGYGGVAEQQVWIDQTPFTKARVRHAVRDTEMHLQMVRAGAGMTFLPIWYENLFPELQRVPGTGVIHNRFMWVLLHEDLRRITRVRIFVDFIANALLELRGKGTAWREK